MGHIPGNVPADHGTAGGIQPLPHFKGKALVTGPAPPLPRGLAGGALGWSKVNTALTVAGSGVFHFQQHARGAGGLLHGALAGVGGVVAGTDGLLGLTLRAQLVAQGTPASASLEVPQALLPAAARDVLTGLCF